MRYQIKILMLCLIDPKNLEKKLTTYVAHTNDTHFKKKKHTTMKNRSDNLRIFHQNIRGLHRKTD